VHPVFPTVEDMLDPAVLSDALGRRVETVDRVPLVPKGHSSTEAQFDGVRINRETTPSLVLKTIDRRRDWVAVATRDVVDREVSVWESGLLDELPRGVGHAVLAGARFDGGSSLLMRNLTEELLADDELISREWFAGVLRSLATMHAGFWQHPVLDRPGPVLCELEQVLGHLGPARLPALHEAVPDHFIIKLIEEGWAGLAALVGSGLATDLQAVAVDPSPVVRALADGPRTLVHADVRPANVAFDGSRATFVDWARPTAAPPAIDLAYLLLMSPPTAPVSPDHAVAYYLKMLASSLGADDPLPWWDDQLDVCMTAVFAMMAAILVNYETNEASDDHPPHSRITWWAERAKPGLRLIERL
jgi:hypothetical protein